MADRSLALPASSARLSELLERVVVSATLKHWPPAGAPLRALILAGSLARWEGSWVEDGGVGILLGDAELLCLLPDSAAPFRPAARRALEEQVMEHAAREGIRADITLTPVRERNLRTLPAHLFGHELRQTGRVLWGDPQALTLVPEHAARWLPRVDAWRLLANRLVEVLPAAMAAEPTAASPWGFYPWVKLYLDMATSYLIFAGEYAPSYGARAGRLRGLVERRAPDGGAESGILTRAFAQQVEACTAWKLSPDADIGRVFGPGWRGRALRDAHALWIWEMQQLTTTQSASRSELWDGWLRRQPLRARLRGWASAMRHVGGRRPGLWPRWLRLAWRASPRHWIYQAAMDLLYTPPAAHDEALARMAARLPLPPPLPPRSAAELADRVLHNFHRLAHSTRA
ncbi:MAG: hypothetical protein ACTHJX_14240 [Terriglobales bacterium]